MDPVEGGCRRWRIERFPRGWHFRNGKCQSHGPGIGCQCQPPPQWLCLRNQGLAIVLHLETLVPHDRPQVALRGSHYLLYQRIVCKKQLFQTAPRPHNRWRTTLSPASLAHSLYLLREPPCVRNVSDHAYIKGRIL